MHKSVPEAIFSKEQLEYLLKLFPPVAHGPDATEAQLRHYNGQQSVLHAVQRKTRGVDPRAGYLPPQG